MLACASASHLEAPSLARCELAPGSFHAELCLQVDVLIHPVQSRPCHPQTPTRMNADHPFALLGLAPELLNAVADLGFTTPTAVQSQAIPLALHDPDAHTQNDLMVSSQTGSGKI